jgi:hypothetical protein
MTKQQCEQSSYQTKNNAKSVKLRNWTAAWVLTMAIAAFAPRFIWDFNTSITMIALLINLAVGFRMLVANREYLRGLDEMQQKILFDAMAFTLGVGLVIGLSYELLEDIKLIGFEPEISHLIIIMCLTYLIAMIAGHRKYR